MTAISASTFDRIALALESIALSLEAYCRPTITIEQPVEETARFDPSALISSLQYQLPPVPVVQEKSVGRARGDTDADLDQVLLVRDAGFDTYNAIAIELGRRGVLRECGKPFHPVTVKRLLRSDDKSTSRAAYTPGLRRARNPEQSPTQIFLAAIPKGDLFTGLLSPRTKLRARACEIFRAEHGRFPLPHEINELEALASIAAGHEDGAHP